MTEAAEVVTFADAIAIPPGLSFAEFDAWFDLAGKTEAELIHEAGILNSGKLANVDHVTIMGMMNRAEMVAHVAKLRKYAA
jgi:hypothetical protein